MKFDLELDVQDNTKAMALKEQLGLNEQPVFVAGSTHDQEENICLDAFNELRKIHRNALLIVVPRHPHRFEKVAQLCQATGYLVVKLSELNGKPLRTSPDILVVDAMGMLKACYQVASCAFVGGSFVHKGGHNALEPALYAVPTIMGPSIFNNPIICDVLENAGGLKILSAPDQLADTALEWFNNADIAQRAGLANKQVIEKNRGAIEQTLEAIGEVFE